jgi:alginate O-acetyltransferase complex protein AlgI
MLFTSLDFVAFLGVLAILFSLIRGHIPRQWLLLLANYVFYGAWNWHFLGLLFGLTMVAWTGGRSIASSASDLQRKRSLVIYAGITLATLCYFKYTNLIYTSFIEAFTAAAPKPLNIILPVAISFTAFEVISYLVDIYRRHIPHEPSFRRFALFMSFFPRLVAGPIIRPADFLPQLDKPIRFSPDNLRLGGQMFLVGLLLKLVAADTLSILVDDVFNNPLLYSTRTLWLAAVSYSGQIFCDFHGYSLMAIGLAIILSFRLPDNFRMPYTSRSLTEFWRRWHISLSSWLRDYLYIPLGGGRNHRAHTLRNLLITMSLGGLWHGASWNFLLWGVLHGIVLSIEKIFYWRRYEIGETPKFCASLISSFQIVSTFLVVTLLWIPFRSPTWQATVIFSQRMFSPSDGIEWLHVQSVFVIASLLIWHLLYIIWPRMLSRLAPTSVCNFKNFVWTSVIIAVICLFASQNQAPFIYFQF